MIAGSVSGLEAFDDALARLARVGELNLAPLAEKIAKILVDGNREGLLAGLDADGVPMAPLAASTAKHRAGTNPPGLPHGAASSLISRFTVRVDLRADATAGRIVAGWNGALQVAYFRTGTRKMPARNPVGIRPATRAIVQDALDEFARSVATGR